MSNISTDTRLRLTNCYKELTVGDALSVLATSYHRRQAVIIRDGLRTSVARALRVWPHVLLDRNCAESGWITFQGGPPGSVKWFTGTVYTMLSDAVLFQRHTKDRPVSELLSL